MLSVGKDGKMLLQDLRNAYFPRQHIFTNVVALSSSGDVAFHRGNVNKLDLFGFVQNDQTSTATGLFTDNPAKHGMDFTMRSSTKDIFYIHNQQVTSKSSGYTHISSSNNMTNTSTTSIIKSGTSGLMSNSKSSNSLESTITLKSSRTKQTQWLSPECVSPSLPADSSVPIPLPMTPSRITRGTSNVAYDIRLSRESNASADSNSNSSQYVRNRKLSEEDVLVMNANFRLLFSSYESLEPSESGKLIEKDEHNKGSAGVNTLTSNSIDDFVSPDIIQTIIPTVTIMVLSMLVEQILIVWK